MWKGGGFPSPFGLFARKGNEERSVGPRAREGTAGRKAVAYPPMSFSGCARPAMLPSHGLPRSILLSVSTRLVNCELFPLTSDKLMTTPPTRMEGEKEPKKFVGCGDRPTYLTVRLCPAIVIASGPISVRRHEDFFAGQSSLEPVAACVAFWSLFHRRRNTHLATWGRQPSEAVVHTKNRPRSTS